MATLAADGLLLPGAGEAVFPVVVVLEQARGMAIGAHCVPVLVAPCPVQWIARSEALAGVEREPALATLLLRPAVPRDRQRLEAAAGKCNQILLQRMEAKGVENPEVRRLAIFPFGIDEEDVPPAEEPSLDARLVKHRIVETAQHVVLGCVAHGPGVIRVVPLRGLLGMTAETTIGSGVTFARGGLLGRATALRRFGPGGTSEDQGGDNRASEQQSCDVSVPHSPLHDRVQPGQCPCRTHFLRFAA